LGYNVIKIKLFINFSLPKIIILILKGKIIKNNNSKLAY